MRNHIQELRDAGIHLECLEPADDSCPGCGAQPGDGVTEGCSHEVGCGFQRKMAEYYENDLDSPKGL